VCNLADVSKVRAASIFAVEMWPPKRRVTQFSRRFVYLQPDSVLIPPLPSLVSFRNKFLYAHFDPEDGGSMHLRNVRSIAHICAV
jgi:hypothetical protein